MYCKLLYIMVMSAIAHHKPQTTVFHTDLHFVVMGMRVGKLSSPDFVDKRGIDTSYTKAIS